MKFLPKLTICPEIYSVFLILEFSLLLIHPIMLKFPLIERYRSHEEEINTQMYYISFVKYPANVGSNPLKIEILRIISKL